LGEPLRLASLASRRAIRSITFAATRLGGSAAIPLAADVIQTQKEQLALSDAVPFIFNTKLFHNMSATL
jgi:hypothetical protein